MDIPLPGEIPIPLPGEIPIPLPGELPPTPMERYNVAMPPVRSSLTYCKFYSLLSLCIIISKFICQVVNLDDEDIPMPSVDHSIVELDDGMPSSDSDNHVQVQSLKLMSQVPLVMRAMLKYYGIVQVDEPQPHHQDHLEMLMIPSR